MSKKIMIPCVINGVVSPVEFQVGNPAEGSDPIAYQSKWLNSSKNGSVPPHIMSALNNLYKVALETNSNFEELCEMAFNQAMKQKQQNAKK